jgi:hypothetical protein
MTLKHSRVLPALSEFGIFYPITTAPPDLAPAHNSDIKNNLTSDWINLQKFENPCGSAL